MPHARMPAEGSRLELSRRGALRMLAGTALGAVALGVAVPSRAFAASGVAQAGADPVVIDQTATTDNVTVLLATAAGRMPDMSVQGGDTRKNFYIDNFLTSSDYLTWDVQVAAGASYQASLLVDTDAGETFTLSVDGTSSSVTFTAPAGWNRVLVGDLALPTGSSTIRLTRGSLTHDVYVKSLELIRASDVAARNTRITAARADTTWLSKAGYGLMFQYGSWGYPHNVGPAKSLDQQAADFDVPAFVEMVQETGAGYVVWSISWWGYHLDAPLSSPDSIVTAAGGPASPGLTSTRDLIGDVAAACQAAGIRFMLYYHTGDEDSAWWPYQNWPATFATNGTGDRSTFFANWTEVVTEIGNRYGSNLDGFFFDDGMVLYYPAAYEQLQKAARAGNSKRLVSWNNWILPAVTDFQDVWFGEGSTGGAQTGSAAAGGNGVFTSGPYQGLLQHGMFTMDDDWGVHTQNTTVSTASTVTSAAAIGWATGAVSRNVPISFDLMMYQDGTVNPNDLRILGDVRQVVRGTAPSVPTGTTTVNDTDTGITYTGSWTHSTGRGAGDLGDDVHWTSTDGDSFSYTFTGTGIDVIGPRSSVSQHFSVAVDGVTIGQFSQYAASYTPQAVLYGARHLNPGTHTVTVTKVDGGYLQLDALRTVPNPTMVNDADAAVSYVGTWTHSTGRGVGDYGDDVHWTSTNGDSATITFTGTGIDVIAPMEAADGTANILLDGAQVGTTDAAYSGSYTPQQFLYQVRGLAPGSHTLKLVKTGGTYVQVDAFQIWP
ncbi:alpha-L-fucosidase [Streptacidiphilus sp. MAP5-3]|uniref:alpha-L-fucosidase n=1 Tax=unclassified Streptacidiphilus TaxID=2643834 RepID=UPI003519534C